MKKSPNYLWRKLQGHFNARKQEFIEALKERGTFIECCSERGFIYAISITAFNEKIDLHVGLKNGEIMIHDMICSPQRQAV